MLSFLVYFAKCTSETFWFVFLVVVVGVVELCTLKRLFCICSPPGSLSCSHNVGDHGWTGLSVEELTTMVTSCLGPSNPNWLEMADLVPPQAFVPKRYTALPVHPQLGNLPHSTNFCCEQLMTILITVQLAAGTIIKENCEVLTVEMTSGMLFGALDSDIKATLAMS